ncbi:winged helix-turn-helix transcriptional regulator [Jannaschia marina]|uniref:winged helix-turn-helix transcriptional regulator n=1 Tax=Jannaschia marina TaxID=2741674 RepID=UPI0015CADDE5|nr:helix-turn-helix domain-containing protein [Jannaschia marina]
MTTRRSLPRARVARPAAERLVQEICGCKWSLTVYRLLDDGITRPGAMVRAVEGLSTKVLNDCLRRNVEFGIIERHSYPEVPPRVEYAFTPFGLAFRKVLSDLAELEESWPDVFRDRR